MITLFPVKKYNIKLYHYYSIKNTELVQVTEKSKILTSRYTKKKFIGTVTKDSFKLITSKIDFGAFCVFRGEFTQDYGTIKIEINRAFRILILVWLILASCVPFIILFTRGNLDYLAFLEIVPIYLLILFLFRFLFLKLAFNYGSKKGLNEITKTLEISEINEYF